jgi:phthiodiolone/phenolphthiodiolone dimycocerosates ketoreductase
MVKFGLHLTVLPVADLVHAGVLAEKYGFTSAWVPDHYTDMPPSGDKVDPWVTLTAIGVQTKNMRLATDVTDVIRAHPTKVAHIAATLDELTGGRVILGLGAGEAMNIVAYGLPWEDPETRVSRLKEAIEVIRLCWKSSRASPVNFEGKFYKLKNAWIDQVPVQKPAPPIYVGALGSPRSLSLVGEVADGWKPWLATPELYQKRLEIIKDAAKRAGRDFESIDKIAFIYTAVTDDPGMRKAAVDAIKPEIIMLTHRKTLKELGFEVPIPETVDYSYQRAPPIEQVVEYPRKAAEAMPDKIAEKFLAVGTPDEVIAGIEKFLKAGAKNVVIKDLIGLYVTGDVRKLEEQIKLIGEKVIPYFKEK